MGLKSVFSLVHLILCFHVCSLVVYSLFSVAIRIPEEKSFVSIAIGFHMGTVLSLGQENDFMEWVSWNRESSAHKWVLGGFWTWVAINQDTRCCSQLPTHVGLSIIRMPANIPHFEAWEEQIICLEQGSRMVYYYLKDTSKTSFLAIIGQYESNA